MIIVFFHALLNAKRNQVVSRIPVMVANPSLRAIAFFLATER